MLTLIVVVTVACWLIAGCALLAKLP